MSTARDGFQTVNCICTETKRSPTTNSKCVTAVMLLFECFFYTSQHTLCPYELMMMMRDDNDSMKERFSYILIVL